MFLILPCIGHYLWEKNVALHVIIVLQSTIELIMTYLLQFSILEVEISLTNRITEGYATNISLSYLSKWKIIHVSILWYLLF